MPHILKNENLEIHIDLPLENYNFSRFDWTGKIVEVKFQNIQVTTVESTTSINEDALGKGFYNEFGIDSPLGFEEAPIGGWFHKIGVGVLRKEDTQYQFIKNYEVKPADFDVIAEPNRLLIYCKSRNINGYSYVLKKEIELQKSGFIINYQLQNTGEKDIITDEYNHNFTAINKELIGNNYSLKFPFQLKPLRFIETVNPEQKIEISQHDITFNDALNEEFFFSNLTGGEQVVAQWTMINIKSNLEICETGNFKTNKVNLWGTQHVISPELFFNIMIKPGQSSKWSRTYNISTIK